MTSPFSMIRKRYADWRWRHRRDAKRVVLTGSGLYLGGLLALAANFSLLSGPLAGLIISLSVFVVGGLIVVVGMRMHIISDYGDDGGGHGGPGLPDPRPGPGPMGSEPPWWPAFEDEFREYAAGQSTRSTVPHR